MSWVANSDFQQHFNQKNILLFLKKSLLNQKRGLSLIYQKTKCGAQRNKGRTNKMAKISTVEIFKNLQEKLGMEETANLLTYISEQNAEAMEEVKKEVLTQKDKIEIITRMDTHFKSLVGIMIAVISLATILAKLF